MVRAEMPGIVVWEGGVRIKTNYIVHGPGHLRCTSKRDQLRVIQIRSLVGGDYKKL